LPSPAAAAAADAAGAAAPDFSGCCCCFLRCSRSCSWKWNGAQGSLVHAISHMRGTRRSPPPRQRHATDCEKPACT
jgi:hypothetical protein